jgi:hypothetical protein
MPHTPAEVHPPQPAPTSTTIAPWRVQKALLFMRTRLERLELIAMEAEVAIAAVRAEADRLLAPFDAATVPPAAVGERVAYLREYAREHERKLEEARSLERFYRGEMRKRRSLLAHLVRGAA